MFRNSTVVRDEIQFQQNRLNFVCWAGKKYARNKNWIENNFNVAKIYIFSHTCYKNIVSILKKKNKKNEKRESIFYGNA